MREVKPKDHSPPDRTDLRVLSDRLRGKKSSGLESFGMPSNAPSATHSVRPNSPSNMHRLCRRQNRLFYLNTFSRSLFSMSSASKDRILSRDVVVTQIPSGDKHTLFAGAKVFIHQVLGGTYTVQGDAGLYRIDGKDADSIGEQVNVETVSAATTADGAPDPTALWDQLRKVYDPEIPVNIVDLGLVYSLDVIKADSGFKVDVAMTLTAPGCGMGPAIAEDAKGKLLLVPGLSEADVRIVWEPTWNQSMISEEGKMKLGLI